MTKEYSDRQDKPLREEYYSELGFEDQPLRVVVDSMPWSGGQAL